MIKHKIIELLRKLCEEEIKSLGKFINSPYFNRSPKIKRLYFELVKFYPEFNNPRLTKEKLFDKLHKGKRYNDSTLRGLMYDLLHLVYRFLVVEGTLKDRLRYEVQTIKELSSRQIFSLAKSELKNADEFEKKHGVDFDYYLYGYLIESYRYNIDCQTVNIHNKKQALLQLSILSKSDIYLLLLFITELISDYVSTVIFASKYNIDTSKSVTRQFICNLNLKEIASSIKDELILSSIFEIHISLFNAFDKLDNRKYYLAYKRRIKQFRSILNHDEIASHYLNLINYLILNNNKKLSSYFSSELFKIYEEYLKDEYFIDSKVKNLKPYQYRAILINALQCKKYEWAEHYINVYSKKVSPDERIAMYHYGYALWYNSIGKSDKALVSIDKIKINNFIFKYDTYNIKLKIFFEYENPEKALDYIHTYNEYLRKDDFFSESRKIPYKNFIKFTKDILIYRDNPKKMDIDFLGMKLSKTESILHKEWLQEKIDNLKNTKKYRKFG